MPHKIFLFLTLGFLKIALSCAQTNPQSFRCSNHDWQSVQDLVFPYLDDEMQTAMVIQAQSSEYQINAAADFALTFEESYHDSLVELLQKIEGC
ncbi:hypothetical protein [Rhodohalobacter sp.]|uniref:hypothetical protein n=1 Tax=Rhodohalobacter sp. TaxID=1974210 RepID=UPI003567C21E